MSDETLMGKTLSALQNMSDNEFLTTIADTEFAFDSNITPTEYFESELNKNTDFNDEAKTSTKASILASIKGETDDSMLIDYAIALTVASKTKIHLKMIMNFIQIIQMTVFIKMMTNPMKIHHHMKMNQNTQKMTRVILISKSLI